MREREREREREMEEKKKRFELAFYRSFVSSGEMRWGERAADSGKFNTTHF